MLNIVVAPTIFLSLLEVQIGTIVIIVDNFLNQIQLVRGHFEHLFLQCFDELVILQDLLFLLGGAMILFVFFHSELNELF